MMDTGSTKAIVHWTSGINAVAGIWLLIAPFSLGYVNIGQALWNDIIFGVVVFVLGLLRFLTPLKHPAYSWTNVIIGLWLIAAPFVLNYSSSSVATWNDIAVGCVVIALAAWSAATTEDRTE